MQWRFVIPAVVFAALVGVFVFVLNGSETGAYDPRDIESPLVGKRAPEFRLPLVADATRVIDSRDLLGKPYVINVWGTWCVACREEHPTLMDIARQNQLPLIGIDWNDERDQALRLLASMGDPYTLNVFDGDGKVAIDLGVYGAPETFFVDAQGIIQYKHKGPLTMQIWQEQFLARARKGAAAE